MMEFFWIQYNLWLGELGAFGFVLISMGGILIWSQILLTLAFFEHLKHRKHKAQVKTFIQQLEPQIMRYLFEDNTPPETIWNQVSPQKTHAFLEALREIASNLKGSTFVRIKTLAQPYLKDLERPLHSRAPEIRAQALKMLSLFAPQTSETQLESALADRSVLVALVAFQALTQPQSQSSITTLLQNLPRFAQFSPELLSSLLYRRGAEIAGPLRELLTTAQIAPNAQEVALDTLILLKDPLSAPVAENLLKTETETPLLKTALRLLEKQGFESAIPGVIKWTQAKDETLRAQAIQTLSILGRQAYQEIYLKALEDPSPWVQRQAIGALKTALCFDALNTLIKNQHPTAPLAQAALAGY